MGGLFMNETKVCKKCKQEKSLTPDYFYKRTRESDGYQPRCKECVNQINKERYERDREKLIEKKRTYYAENKELFAESAKKSREKHKEKNLIRAKEYRENNKESLKAGQKKCYEQNKEHYKQYKREWYFANKERLLDYRSNWGKENKDKDRAHKQKYKAKMKQLPYTLTIDEWNNIKEHFSNECAYCGMTEEEHSSKWSEQLHQEHFIPLSSGGEYTSNNIIPACKSCNCSKNDSDFFMWYPKYEHYDKGREKKILKYLNYKNEKEQQLSIQGGAFIYAQG